MKTQSPNNSEDNYFDFGPKINTFSQEQVYEQMRALLEATATNQLI